MPDFNPGSYCGLYCGACDVMVAYRNAMERGTTAEWSGMPTEMRNLPFDTTHAEIKCHGCKTGTVFVGCGTCPLRTCAMKKVGLDTCLDCKRYPCWRFGAIKLVRTLMRLESKLPHLKTIRPNLAAIRSGGYRAWLDEQHRQWTCQTCGLRLSWYRPTCRVCADRGRTSGDAH
jgi:hypothetical protein